MYSVFYHAAHINPVTLGLKTGMGYLDYPSEYVLAQLSINHVTLLNTPIEAMYQVMGMLISRK